MSSYTLNTSRGAAAAQAAKQSAAGKAQQARQRKQAAALISGLVLLVAIVAAMSLGKSVVSRPPGPNSSNIQGRVMYAASDNFSNLPYTDRAAYLNSWDQLSADDRRAAEARLTDDQRQTFRENMRDARFDGRVLAYFKLPPGAARQAYLKQMMGQFPRPSTQPTTQPTSQPAGGPGGPGGRGGAGGRGGGPNGSAAQRMRGAQSGDAAMKAMRTQFVADMVASRVAAGGMPFGGRGGR
jgi:hypothetical protein